MARTKQKQKRSIRGGKNRQKNSIKKLVMTQIAMMVWSLTQSQACWSVKSNGPQEALLQTKLVEVMEFQLSYFKSSKCCIQYARKFGNFSNVHRTGKGQFSLQSQRKAMPKNVQSIVQFSSVTQLCLTLCDLMDCSLPDFPVLHYFLEFA